MLAIISCLSSFQVNGHVPLRAA